MGHTVFGGPHRATIICQSLYYASSSHDNGLERLFWMENGPDHTFQLILGGVRCGSENWSGFNSHRQAHAYCRGIDTYFQVFAAMRSTPHFSYHTPASGAQLILHIVLACLDYFGTHTTFPTLEGGSI